jgi:poly-gamma-glutamate synthesis protein (capsule biosynthesis protein)
VVERGGVRFGFLAFNAIGETPRATAASPGAFSLRMPPRTGPLNAGDLAAVTKAVRTLKAAVDVVVVLPHWGQQYTHTPVAAQRMVAGALTAAGADLVIGGHPHWVQSVQFPAGKVVAHSLGNLVFDMDFSRQTQEGVLLELTYWGKTLKAARLTPYVIGSDFSPRVVSGTRAERILAGMR